MTFLVSTRLPAGVRDDIRIAGGALGVGSSDFADGMPIPPNAVAVVASLPPGARRIPSELARLASRASLRIVLCASEPMVRPVTTLLGGRVILIAPPFEPQRLRRGLLAATAGTATAPVVAGQAGQSLSTEWWLAWSRHPDHGAVVELVESAIDATVLVGAGCTTAQAEQVAEVMRTAVDDDALERDLAATLEDTAVLRLSAALGEWIVYAPPVSGVAWLCSPWRAPAQWCLSKAITAAGRHVARLPAYPRDVLLLCDHVPATERVVAAMERGAIEAYATLRTLAAEIRLAGALVEAR